MAVYYAKHDVDLPLQHITHDDPPSGDVQASKAAAEQHDEPRQPGATAQAAHCRHCQSALGICKSEPTFPCQSITKSIRWSFERLIDCTSGLLHAERVTVPEQRRCFQNCHRPSTPSRKHAFEARNHRATLLTRTENQALVFASPDQNLSEALLLAKNDGLKGKILYCTRSGLLFRGALLGNCVVSSCPKVDMS